MLKLKPYKIVRRHGVNCGCITEKMCTEKAFYQSLRISKRNDQIKESNVYRSARRRRMERIARNGGSHTLEEWEVLKNKFGGKCAICGVAPKYLQRDHIVPIFYGGRDDIENIQPVCWPCNFKKGTRQ